MANSKGETSGKAESLTDPYLEKALGLLVGRWESRNDSGELLVDAVARALRESAETVQSEESVMKERGGKAKLWERDHRRGAWVTATTETIAAALIAAMRNALPLLLDLVEAADRFIKQPSPFDEVRAHQLENYDTARAALEKVGMG